VKRFDGCEECARLWDKFASSTYRVVRLKSRVRIAVLAHDQEAERLLLSQLRGAEQEKLDDKSVLERHEAEAHGTRAISAEGV
jgi:hypothetical protein